MFANSDRATLTTFSVISCAACYNRKLVLQIESIIMFQLLMKRLTFAAKLSAEAACSVLATEAFWLFESVASGKLGVELAFLLKMLTIALFTSTLVDNLLLLSREGASVFKNSKHSSREAKNALRKKITWWWTRSGYWYTDDRSTVYRFRNNSQVVFIFSSHSVRVSSTIIPRNVNPTYKYKHTTWLRSNWK